MKTKPLELTPKQQERTRAKIFRLLAAMGFRHEPNGDYWWCSTQEGGVERVCVKFGAPNPLFAPSWNWQRSTTNTSPQLGYSGSCSLGASFGHVERVMRITLEQFYCAGIAREAEFRVGRFKQAREIISAGLAKLQVETAGLF